MGSVVIVAIPEENDRTWKISSEKSPHLTLLFLGEEGQISNLDQIMQFVEHAANTSLKRFYLPVDRRGELGDAKADVLFFKKGRYDFKAVRDFRSLLLKDPNIKSAYDATSQFETPPHVGAPGQAWVPHLTLGYPESPAKPIPDDHMANIYDVSFDRLAIWTGDYEGPEFVLKDYWDDIEELGIPMDVAMSDIQHYGVKGMRWGTRREGATGGGSAGGVKEVAKKGLKVADNVNFSLHTESKVVKRNIANDAAVALKRSDLPAIKAKHGDYGKLTKRATKPFSDEAKAYRKDVKEAYVKRLEESANRRTNFQRNRRFTMKDEQGNPNTSKYYWQLRVEKIEKAGGPGSGTSQFGKAKHDALSHAEGDIEFKVQPIFDDEGYIVDIKVVDEEEEMAQAADLGADFLAHYGVKGMRWGVRKSEESGGDAGSGAGGGKLDKIKKGAKESAKFIGDVNFETDSRMAQERERIESDAHEALKRTDLPVIKEKHGDYGKLRNRAKQPFSSEAKAYRKDVREAYVKRLEEAANLRTNSSRTRQYTIRERGWELPPEGGALPQSKHYWDLSTREIKHADGTVITTTFEVLEEDGYITGLKKVELENALAQTMDLGSVLVSSLINGDEDVLEHYGVKGMRWGQRKAPPEAVAPVAISRVPNGAKRKTKIETKGGENQPASEDAIKVAQAKAKLVKSGPAALSNRELQEVANRVELEARVIRATRSPAKKFIANLLETQGKNEINTRFQADRQRRFQPPKPKAAAA